MLRTVVPRPLPVAAALLAACAVATGCGEEEPSDEQQVRDALAAFGSATAGKDYDALCERVLAPSLVEDVESIGLPCEVALERALGDVEAPTLAVGRVRVQGDEATAEVRSSAAGQDPSRDVVELVRVEDGWRVASLAGQSPPSPAP
jgi:hypothetical protein